MLSNSDFAVTIQLVFVVSALELDYSWCRETGASAKSFSSDIFSDLRFSAVTNKMVSGNFWKQRELPDKSQIKSTMI